MSILIGHASRPRRSATRPAPACDCPLLFNGGMLNWGASLRPRFCTVPACTYLSIHSMSVGSSALKVLASCVRLIGRVVHTTDPVAADLGCARLSLPIHPSMAASSIGHCLRVGRTSVPSLLALASLFIHLPLYSFSGNRLDQAEGISMLHPCRPLHVLGRHRSSLSPLVLTHCFIQWRQAQSGSAAAPPDQA